MLRPTPHPIHVPLPHKRCRLYLPPGKRDQLQKSMFHNPVPTQPTTKASVLGNMDNPTHRRNCHRLLRKEVIQPQLPLRLPCYDLVLVTGPTFDGSPPQKWVRPPASGVTDFHDLTGGVYKPRERIHRSVADLRLLATPTSWGRVADPNPN